MTRYFVGNTILFHENVAIVDVGKGLWFKVDKDDVDKIEQYRWRAVWNPVAKSYYITTSVPAETRTGTTSLYLHRFLLDAPKGTKVDHRNGDTLDNRRENIRIVTMKQNLENRRNEANSNSKTGIRGVSVHKGASYKGQPRKMYYVARVHDANGKGKAKYFPYTTEGLEQASEAVKRIREEVFTHSDGR